MYMVMKKVQKVKVDERGFASLVVAFIFIIIMSLVTVGFAQLARHEQQNSLDKQLAHQAYYAAESGLNEIRSELPAMEANPTGINPNTCLGAPYVQGITPANPNAGTIDTSTDVTYTCALVNLNPPQLVGSDTSTFGSLNFVFATTPATLSLTTMTFSWGSNDQPSPHNTPQTSFNGVLPQLGSWGSHPPFVQFSITPVNPGGLPFSRDSLINNTFTAFLYPSTGPISDSAGKPLPVGSIAYAPDALYPNSSPTNAQIVGATYDSTNTQYPFSVTITGLPGTPGETWDVHVIYFYDPLKVSLGNYLAGSTSLNTTNSEAQVDVTGKAKNVVKRIVAYVPVSQTNSGGTQSTQNGVDTLPPLAVTSGSTCKHFSTNPSAAGLSNGGTNFGAISADCKLDKP
jgi:hypothetical protein